MTSASVALSEPSAAARSSTGTGAVLEFLLVGGVTLVLFPLLWLLRAAVGLDASELAVGFVAFHAAHLINDPHFSVTYLLFYRNVRQRALGADFPQAQRIRYLVAGFVVPVALAGWCVLALVSRSAATLGGLMELMFLLVGWHYVKQGFGVLTVLWARRGVRMSGLERNVVMAHCFAGWAYAWASPTAPGRLVEEKGVVYRALAHPAWLDLSTAIVFFGTAVALLFVLARKWRREGALPLGPIIGFVASVWLWTVFSSVDPLMIYVIPALHSVQYLYFVWLLRKNEAREAEGPPSFGKPVAVRLAALAASALGLGWLLFHGAPEFLDGVLFASHSTGAEASGELGKTPYFAALFAFVNIHHYFMDHVIWRRENPEARHLVRP